VEGLGVTDPIPGFWDQRPVLVTGCTGLLGSWLTKALLDRGAAVVGLIRDWLPECELSRSGALHGITVVRGAVQDQATLERILGEYEIDTVFHLAAQTIVGVANRNPVSTFEANIGGTWCMLEACRRSPLLRQIVIASSDKAYGTSESLPYTELAPLQGRHPYDVSKSCADLIAQSYAQTYDLPICVTRCGNLYGGGDLNWSRLIPGTIRSVLRGERPIIRSNGRCVRDYFYVEDGVNAYLCLAEQLAERRDLAGEAFNFSNETQMTVLELVQTILRLCDREELQPEVRAEALHEISHQYLDAGKARQQLAWRPCFTLEEGLTRTITWYRSYLGQREERYAVQPLV
jgi:CDP-glucose 4,6-dehydratase